MSAGILERPSILVTDFVSEFQPIANADDARSPAWFAVRYVYSQSTIFFNLLDHIEADYKNFKYSQRQPREKPIVRSWFPGYIFLSIDLAQDNWQQIFGIPGFLEILGGPTALPDGLIEALDRHLLKNLHGRDPGVKFNPGDSIVIAAGAFKDRPAIVSAFNQRQNRVEVVAMIFGRPCKATLDVVDVRAV
jgi:transcription termination/antitermination protein NusG